MRIIITALLTLIPSIVLAAPLRLSNGDEELGEWRTGK